MVRVWLFACWNWLTVCRIVAEVAELIRGRQNWKQQPNIFYFVAVKVEPKLIKQYQQQVEEHCSNKKQQTTNTAQTQTPLLEVP